MTITKLGPTQAEFDALLEELQPREITTSCTSIVNYIISSGYRIGNLAIVTGIGTTNAALVSGENAIWNVPAGLGYTSISFQAYGYQNGIRGFVYGDKVYAFSDIGTVAAGMTFIFMAVYALAPSPSE